MSEQMLLMCTLCQSVIYIYGPFSRFWILIKQNQMIQWSIACNWSVPLTLNETLSSCAPAQIAGWLNRGEWKQCQCPRSGGSLASPGADGLRQCQGAFQGEQVWREAFLVQAPHCSREMGSATKLSLDFLQIRAPCHCKAPKSGWSFHIFTSPLLAWNVPV